MGDVETDARDSIDAYLAAARRDDKHLTPVAVRALADIGAAAVPALANLLRDDGWIIQEETLGALVRLGDTAGPAVPELVRAAIRPSQAHLRSICGKLATWPDAAVAELVDALKTTTGFKRRGVTECLRWMGDAAAPALPALLEIAFHANEAAADRAACIRIIPALGPVDKELLDKLLEIVRVEQNETILGAAISALGWIEPKAKVAVPSLAAVVRGTGSSSLRAEALRSIWWLRPPADVMVPLCTEILGDEEPRHLKTQAVEALVKYGPETATAWHLVQPLLGAERESSLRAGALRAMLAMDLDPEVVMPELLNALRTGGRFMRERAIGALADMGRRAEEAIPELLNVAESDELNDGAAAYALGLILDDLQEVPPEVTDELRSRFEQGRRKRREREVGRDDDLVGEVMVGNAGLEGARVGLVARSRPGSPRLAALRVASTDELGTFRFSDVAPGRYQLVVVHAECAPRISSVNFGEASRSRPRIKLQRVPATTFTVVDQNDNPLPGVIVLLDGYRAGLMPPVELRTGQNGEFAFPVGGGFVSGTISHDGYMHARVVLSDEDGRNQIQLKRPYRIQGTVTDADTGRRIPRFTVSRVIGGGKLSRAYSPEGQILGEFTNGAYEVSFGETSDLPPPFDELALSFASPGYRKGSTPPYRDGDGDRTFDVQLVPQGRTTGQVLDSLGTPVPGAVVTLATPGTERPGLRNGRIVSFLDRLPSYAADTQGRFSIPAQTTPFTLTVADDRGFAFVTESEFDESSTLQLVEWARLSGTVRSGPGPWRSGRVSLVTPGSPGDATAPAHRQRPYFQYDLTTDDNGRFLADRVRPGPVHVSLLIKVGAGSFVGRGTHELELRPGESMKISIGGGGTRVFGRINLPTENGDAARYGAVRCESLFGGLVFDRTKQGLPESQAANISNVPRPYFPFGFHEDGFFEIEDVPIGKYRLVLLLRCGESAAIGDPNLLVEHDFDVQERRAPESLDLGDLTPRSLPSQD